MKAALVLLVLLPGCQWAQVRYLKGAEKSTELLCQVKVNDLVCRDLYQALKQDGVTLIPNQTGQRQEL